MDATVKRQGLLRRLQMPGANKERMIDVLDHAEVVERGEEPGWAEERKRRLRKKQLAEDTEFNESEDSTQIIGPN